ncbi:hypothetical protein EV121DRAFT_274342, partial [Schizophyllum commune]
VGLDVLLARSRRICQPQRRVLDMVVVPADFLRALPIANCLQMDTKCAESFFCALSKAKICEVGVKCAKWTRNLANRRQMRRGPRGNPSLTAATCTHDHVREVEGLRNQKRGALPGFQQQTEKSANRRQMDRGPRLKFSSMSAAIEGGDSAARSVAYNAISELPLGRRPSTPLSNALRMLSVPPVKRSAVRIMRCLDAMQGPFAGSGTSPSSQAIPRTTAAQQRSQATSTDQSDSEATYRRPASEDPHDIAISPPLSLLDPPSRPFPTALGDE